MDQETSEWIDVDIPKAKDLTLIYASGHGHVYKYNHYALKLKGWGRELEIMNLAGDCSITPRGRVLKGGEVVGIIMDLGLPIDVSSLDLSTRRILMSRIISLVNALHMKGILHGDIKLANILKAPDGSLRFCDFDGSQKEKDAGPPEEQTLNWISKERLMNLDLPLSRADDFFALGLTIWELFSGKVPFEGLREDEVEKEILDGKTVDLGVISEMEVREIIQKYLAMGRRLDWQKT